METYHEKKPEQIRAAYMQERFAEWERRMEAKRQAALQQRLHEEEEFVAASVVIVNKKNEGSTTDDGKGKVESTKANGGAAPPLPPAPHTPPTEAEKQAAREKQLAIQSHRVQLSVARKILKEKRDPDGFLLLEDEIWIPHH